MRRNPLRSSLCIVLSVILVAVSVAGCAGIMANTSSSQSALICGAGGAVAGAAAGAAIGGSGRRATATSTLIGAGIGALVGAIVASTACFAIAEYRSQQVRTYDETKQTFNYQPMQGEIVQITRFEITPAAASPGTAVSFNAMYYVMTPDAQQDIAVTETRIVKLFEAATNSYKELGRTMNEVTVKPGTRQVDGKWQVGSGVTQGKYLILFEVAKAARNDSKELPLVVTNNQAVLRSTTNRSAVVVAEGTKAPDAEMKTAGAGESAKPIADSAGGTSLAALGEQQPKAPASNVAVPDSTERKVTYFLASKVSGRGNVREGPNAKHKIIGEIQSSERFLIVDQTTNSGEKTPWYKIRLENGREGWVAGSLGEVARE